MNNIKELQKAVENQVNQIDKMQEALDRLSEELTKWKLELEGEIKDRSGNLSIATIIKEYKY